MTRGSCIHCHCRPASTSPPASRLLRLPGRQALLHLLQARRLGRGLSLLRLLLLGLPARSACSHEAAMRCCAACRAAPLQAAHDKPSGISATLCCPTRGSSQSEAVRPAGRRQGRSRAPGSGRRRVRGVRGGRRGRAAAGRDRRVRQERRPHHARAPAARHPHFRPLQVHLGAATPPSAGGQTSYSPPPLPPKLRRARTPNASVSPPLDTGAARWPPASRAGGAGSRCTQGRGL